MPGAFDGIDLTPNAIELARREAAARPGFIDLTSANPTREGLLFPAEILERAAVRHLRSRRYDPDPRGLPAARRAVAGWYAGRTPPLAVGDDAIFLTASTSEAYALLFALLADPGDNLLAPDITYPLFEHLAQLRGIELRPYRLDPSRGWAIDGPSLLDAADKRTRGILVVSPHNPTGAVVAAPVPELTALGLPVICDEVFAPYPCRLMAVPPLGTLHPDLPVFHLNGISKLFALPDLKLGWIACSGRAAERFGDRLELLNDALLGANILTQSILPDLFTEGVAFTAQVALRVREGIATALEAIRGSDSLRAGEPDGGWYVFPEALGWSDEEALVLHLIEHGLLVHPGYFFGHEGEARIAISCLVEPARLREGLGRLVRALARRS
jgi:aspartate/methionine/tyrosine aminotransferase